MDRSNDVSEMTLFNEVFLVVGCTVRSRRVVRVSKGGDWETGCDCRRKLGVEAVEEAGVVLVGDVVCKVSKVELG